MTVEDTAAISCRSTNHKVYFGETNAHGWTGITVVTQWSRLSYPRTKQGLQNKSNNHLTGYHITVAILAAFRKKTSCKNHR